MAKAHQHEWEAEWPTGYFCAICGKSVGCSPVPVTVPAEHEHTADYDARMAACETGESCGCGEVQREGE